MLCLGKSKEKYMKKNLKNCVEIIEESESQILLDMNRYDMIEASGATPDLRHKKSAHMTAGWRFADRTRIAFPMEKATLPAFRSLTFSVFSVGAAGGSFCLMFDTDEQGAGKNGYECTLPLSRDGWNSYRVELPFLRAVGEPGGWDAVKKVCFDCVAGGQANSADAVLYIDNLFLWEGMAPPLYKTLPEIKGAAVFSKTGNFSIVDRKRVSNSVDEADAKPFERDGVLWLPMAPVAAGIAHSAVVDNRALTLSFTYRRKKYFFSAEKNSMTVGEDEVALGFYPIPLGGTLFFPLEFVRTFFHWRQSFTDPTGLVVLSNRKHIFDTRRDAALIWQLVSDCTFLRPRVERVLNDLHRRFPNPGRGRLLASFDELMQLRRDAKTDAALGGYIKSLKETYGHKTEAFLTEFDAAAVCSDRLTASAKKLLAFAMLYRVTGDKAYAERTAAECEALSALTDWSLGSMSLLGTVTLSVAVAYDWCHHVWSEGRKAIIERGMLRNGMRVGLEAYDGKLRMWHMGGTAAATVGAGMLAMSIALADIYPQTVIKLLERILRNIEPCFAAYSPDGGYAESVAAWEKSSRGLVLIVSMLRTACGSDYGLSAAPGFLSTAYFPLYTETASGAWNYHNAAEAPVDTSLLFAFSKQTGDMIPAWMRRQQLLSGKKAIDPMDILFYTPVDDAMIPQLPLDAVYRKAGLAIMRASWSADACFVGLHGGANHEKNADLDAGSVILEMGGERFFVETGKVEALPELLRRRAAGQNTLVVEPAAEPAPDQNPDAYAPLLEMRSSASASYAVVDMTTTNDAILRAKRGVLLTENRSVAVIQDEATFAHPATAVWTVWTRAEVKLTASGRAATLTQNGKTLACKLAGVGAPARFEVKTYENTDLKSLTVCVQGKEKLRMAVVCRLLAEGESPSQKAYDIIPMSRWGE